MFSSGKEFSAEDEVYMNEMELNFTALRESLDDMHRYARTNPTAMPRTLLYESMLQSLCGEHTAAIVTLQGGLEEAVAHHMPYEEALCRGELGMLTEDGEMVEEVRRVRDDNMRA